ncbi:MAG TPA: methionyl-tRNA formyltransferase [Planctomycetes bacterium]|nr:methionyl-tRNA formyltransferase [Planctomycetota bacterium]
MSAEASIVFFGSPEAAVPALRALHEAFNVVLVVTQPDRPAGRGRRWTPPPVKSAALELGIPVYQPNSLHCSDALVTLAAVQPDFLVVLAYGEILPADALSLPRIAPVNAHMSLLPRHRGPSPVSAAILAGDSHTGVSTMRMERKMDTGPLFLSKSVPIAPADTAGSLSTRLATLAAELLVATLKGILDGSLSEQPQQGEPSYSRILKKVDGLIDWNAPAAKIERMTRAYFPWPAAFTCFAAPGGGRRMLRILKSSADECRNVKPAAAVPHPGEVLSAATSLEVACAPGVLSISRVQPEGRQPMCIRDFLNGHRLLPGTVLG